MLFCELYYFCTSLKLGFARNIYGKRFEIQTVAAFIFSLGRLFLSLFSGKKTRPAAYCKINGFY